MSPRQRVQAVAAVAVLLIIPVWVVVRYVVGYNQGIDLFRRAMREMEAKHYDAAIALLDAASQKKLGATTMSFVYGNRGWAYLEKGLHDQAIRDLSESIRINAEPVYVFWDRGLAYHRKGEFEKALIDYGEALARDPNLAWAHHNRGKIFASACLNS
jgi:tetratricopeptide (TPR) repeat protein